MADIFGEGEDWDEDTPLVWIPGGGGRLILGVGGGGTAATTGAMARVKLLINNLRALPGTKQLSSAQLTATGD